MILVIIIAMAWLAILGPGFVKRRWQAGEIGSISHFHNQLRVLEHSGPEPIVAPAYRLRSVDGSVLPGEAGGRTGGPTPAPVLTVVGASQLPRPALAFLAEEPVAPRLGSDRFLPDGPVENRGPMAGRAGMDAVGTQGRMALADSRYRIRKRRRDTLGVMAVVFAVTLAVGAVSGAGPAWIVAALSGLALGGYVALLVHMRRLSEERERKLRYLRPEGSRPAGYGMATGSATAGSRGGSASMGGRYSHPSYQAVAH
jgi:hypothetical protein